MSKNLICHLNRNVNARGQITLSILNRSYHITSYKNGRRICSYALIIVILNQAKCFLYTLINLRSFIGIIKNSQEFLNSYKKSYCGWTNHRSTLVLHVLVIRDYISLYSDFLLFAAYFLLLFILSHNIELHFSKITTKKLNKLGKLIT